MKHKTHNREGQNMRDAQIGDYVKPDGWNIGERLTGDDGYSDSNFPGCQFRLQSSHEPNLAVNIKVTGRKVHYNWTSDKVRCQIEFVGDGGPSVFSGGWLHYK